MADIDKYKLSEQEIRKVAERDASSIMKEWEEGLLSTEEALQKFAKVGQETVKSVARMGNEFTKMAIASQKYTDNLTKQALKEQQNSSWLSRTKNWLYSTPTKDDMAVQYRARQMAGGIESILSGNILSGFRQLGSTVPRIANFMGGPLYAAMTALSTAVIGAIDSFTKFRAESSRLSGGISNIKGDRYTRAFQTYALTTMFGQNNKDYDKFLMSNIGWAGRQAMWENKPYRNEFARTWASTRAAFEQVGANPDLANSLMLQQRSIGMSPDNMRRFNNRLVEATKSLDVMGSDKFINAYQELNKTLIANNINGMASAKMFAKFEDQLNKGTLTVADFTKGLTSRRGAETSTLAGVGAMLAERGLGGKELQEAYARGDMIAVAGLVRRGGQQMQRDIEKIAPEMAQRIGTADWKEALALQSGTSWGQMTGDLKNLEVQKILTSGGSLVQPLENLKQPITKEELDTLNKAESDLIKETTDLTGAFEALGKAIKGGWLAGGAYLENNKNIGNTTLQPIQNFIDPIGSIQKNIKAVITLASPGQTSQD